jgi:hypothetical protein
MKRRNTGKPPIEPRIVNMGGQFYGQSPWGQMVRIDSYGNPVQRTRMSKKERLRLRKELREIGEAGPQEPAGKAVGIGTSAWAVNPKSESQLIAWRERAEAGGA